MAAIAIEGVHKSFGAVPVLRGVDLSIGSGEFVVLVGPSGCGKSTLLRLIAGLEDLTQGEIRIDGRRVNDLPPKDRDLAMVFQSYALYPHMSVRGNMSYSLRLRRRSADAIARAVDGAARMLGLEALGDRKPRALSGGQRQRVAMGRAIVREPKAFLFDEPLSNLDARLREQMRFEVKKLHRDLGATSIYVTHDQIEAMTMADRIVAMNAGLIQQVGAPLDLYDDPANTFVAGFIGSPAINFLEGQAIASPGGTAVALAGTPLRTLPDAAPLRPGDPVTVGIRPERIRLGAQGHRIALSARAELLEPTGVGSVVFLDLEGQSVKAFTTERVGLAAGERVPLGIDPDDVLLFHPETGNRIG